MPSSPLRVSLPAPPKTRSNPSPARTVSSPAPAQITSLSGVPVSTSASLVPEMVQTGTGCQLGARSVEASLVSRAWPVPSAFITNRSMFPPPAGSPAYAMIVPSGDQEGWASSTSAVCVRFTSLVPSAFIT